MIISIFVVIVFGGLLFWIMALYNQQDSDKKLLKMRDSKIDYLEAEISETESWLRELARHTDYVEIHEVLQQRVSNQMAINVDNDKGNSPRLKPQK